MFQLTAKFLFIIFTLAILAGCGSESAMKENILCENSPEISVACDIKNPEDLVYFAPTNEIIFGQFGGMITGDLGALSSLNPDTMDTRDLTIVRQHAGENWGEANCKALAKGKLSPHGIDLSRRGDGRWQLLVVNHYQRESIEFFEVQVEEGVVVLFERGCVQMPVENRINDVTATNDTSGFLVTHMHQPEDTFAGKLASLKILLGLDTGYVLEWNPELGFKRLPGSDGSLPNGIIIAPDGGSYYLNQYAGSKVSHIDRRSGELLAAWDISYPDNSAWGSDGKLYVSSALGAITDVIDCPPRKGFNCMQPFAIYSIDPKDGTQQLVYTHKIGLIPVATVAIPLNGALYLGSYSGDRLSRVTLK